MTEQETVRFSGSVAAGDVEEHTMQMEQDATVEEVTVRFYRGPELALEIEPFAKVGEQGRRDRKSLVDLVGRNVIVGDAETLAFLTRQPVEREEVVGVEVRNTTDEGDGYAYDFAVDVTLDYGGGTGSGVVAALKEAFTGVLG